uniref:Protein kinase domain-containing protein n=1 Tax=Parascaris univalens TaxID=6257 RepID=A0A915A5N5_PARUN
MKVTIADKRPMMPSSLPLWIPVQLVAFLGAVISRFEISGRMNRYTFTGVRHLPNMRTPSLFYLYAHARQILLEKQLNNVAGLEFKKIDVTGLELNLPGAFHLLVAHAALFLWCTDASPAI